MGQLLLHVIVGESWEICRHLYLLHPIEVFFENSLRLLVYFIEVTILYYGFLNELMQFRSTDLGLNLINLGVDDSFFFMPMLFSYF